MNKADLWAGNTAPNPQSGNVEVRAADTARLIAARPSQITITRPDTGTSEITLAPQTVRVEIFQGVRQIGDHKGQIADISRQYVVLIGYKDHPTIPDTDIQRADTFFYEGFQWEIADLITTIPGRLLASGEVTP